MQWSWQRALTLAERARLRSGCPSDRSAACAVTERGRKRLAKWKSQSAFASDSLFEKRLEQAGLTEPQLLELLSDTAGTLPEALVESPGWVVELAGALADSSPADLRVRFDGHRSRHPSQIRLLELVRPLIVRAVSRLRAGLKSLAVSTPAVPFEPEKVEAILVNLLPDRLLPILLRTLVLELNVARVQGHLAGETSEDRFESFVARLQRPEVRWEFFCEYPVLGRQISQALEQWLSCSLEFLQRWSADWPALRASFAAEANPGSLASVEGDAGDRHRGGRAVWIIQCQSGFKVVYKPKPMAVDQHFQELLGWLNDRGLTAPFRQLKVLNRGAYGWEEFVAPEDCSSPEAVARFYERSGGYLALLYALAATDFHHENILASGEHPMLVDLEALFHAPPLDTQAQEASDLAGESFFESVLGAGLLPVPIWSSRDADTFDVSGLGADANQKLTARAPAWEDLGTDHMHFARRKVVIGSASHRPTLNGAATHPLDFLEALESGFQQVYQLLVRHRDELLAPGGMLERFAQDEVRVLLRDTATYGDLLVEGSHPDVLRDALDRDRLFDRLWEDVKDRPTLAQFIPAETEALWGGDVPLFTTRADSRDCKAGTQRRFENVLNESGLQHARQRLTQFGPEDLQRQLWFLRASITTMASRTRALARDRRRRSLEQGPPAGRDQFLAAARAVGDRLEATAFQAGAQIAWVGLTLMREKKWVLAPVGMDLYDGVPGIGLFLAYLGAVSGQERYTALARATVSTLRQRLRPDQRQRGLSELGAFTGWGGILYTLSHLGVLWHDAALLAEAEEMVEVLPDRIGNDKDLDIIGGAAGCIAALLCLQSCQPSARVLAAAVQCGEHLLGRAKPMPQGLGWESPYPTSGPLAGFSHGAAGISWALLELAARTGEERFRAAALGGVAYERGLFSAEAGNWPDLRPPDDDNGGGSPKPSPFMMAWCHGAPGIGLARLLSRRREDDPHFEAEIETALRTTSASGFGSNHCLCHGDLGNLELLLVKAHASPGSPWSQKADELAAGILNSIKRDGWLCGNPLAVESPGLMTGLAGIGYGLLRCAEPAKMPSVLSLAPPIPI